MKRERVIRLPRKTNLTPVSQRNSNRPQAHHRKKPTTKNWLRQGIEMLALLDVIESLNQQKVHSQQSIPPSP